MTFAPTVADLLRQAEKRLAEAGIDTPRLDARLLAEAALGLTREQLLLRPAEFVGAVAAERFQALVDRRAAREPVSRILGRREFWSLDFTLAPDTLDPRPDTETLVEGVLRALPDRSSKLRLLDLGTGSGCILLALLSELPAAWGIGIDLSPYAAAAARANAVRLGLGDRAAFLAGSWAGALAGAFDVIVSNPPYIPDADLAGLDPEVRLYDPARALAGGPDGLDCYRALLPQVRRLLRPDGVAGFEHGAGQGADVARLASEAGLRPVGQLHDLAGHDRAVMARLAG